MQKNSGFFYRHWETLLGCCSDCFIIIANLFRILLSLLITSSALSKISVFKLCCGDKKKIPLKNGKSWDQCGVENEIKGEQLV